jgi:hypothetical protein
MGSPGTKRSAQRQEVDQGSVRCMAKCVAKGYAQIPELNFTETFAPVVNDYIHPNRTRVWYVSQMGLRASRRRSSFLKRVKIGRHYDWDRYSSQTLHDSCSLWGDVIISCPGVAVLLSQTLLISLTIPFDPLLTRRV